MAATETRPAAAGGPGPKRKPEGKGGGARGALNDPTVAGAIIILVAVIATILSYNANRGLPFVPSYDVNVAVPNAAELIPGSSEVRVSGSRIGIVTGIKAIPAKGTAAPYALLKLRLDKNQEDLPSDTLSEVRPRSVLGAKFLDLTKGSAKTGIAPGGTLPLGNARQGVELSEAFKTFSPAIRLQIQRSIGNLANAVAGRGPAINDSILAAGQLLQPLNNTLKTLIDPNTELASTIRAVDSGTAALAPTGGDVASILRDVPPTMDALHAAKPELQSAITQLAGTANAGRAAAASARPVLANAAVLFRNLRPGAEVLPSTARRLTTGLRVGRPILGRLPATAKRLNTALNLLGSIAKEDTTIGSIQRLSDTVTAVQQTLNVLLPAQVTCNVAADFVNNIASVTSEGDAQGTWLDQAQLIDGQQSYQQATQSDTLEADPVPTNDASECETGNEPYLGGKRVGSPAGLQPASTKTTSPPAGVGG